MAFVTLSKRECSLTSEKENEHGITQIIPKEINFSKNPFYNSLHRENYIPPFNTTSLRTNIVLNTSDFPGPGAYYSITSKKIVNNYTENNDNSGFVFNKNIPVGFLTKSQRFLETENDSNPGPGQYISLKTFQEPNKTLNIASGKVIKGTVDSEFGSKTRVNSIPLKNTFGFYYDARSDLVSNDIKKKKKLEKELIITGSVGPGQYNINSNWKKGSINWKNQNPNIKPEYLSELTQMIENPVDLNRTSSFQKLKNHFIITELNNQSKAFNTSNSFDINSKNHRSSNSLSVPNSYIKTNTGEIKAKRYTSKGLDKNKMNEFLVKQRKKYNKIVKNNINNLENNKLVQNDLQFNDYPGPGFYSPKNTKNINSNFKQNFGIFQPKLRIEKITRNENVNVGPGVYFQETSRFEIKDKNKKHNLNLYPMHSLCNKIPPKEIKKLPAYQYKIIEKNKNLNIGPGTYDVKSLSYEKKEISNVSNFGSLQERFSYIIKKEENDIPFFNISPKRCDTFKIDKKRVIGLEDKKFYQEMKKKKEKKLEIVDKIKEMNKVSPDVHSYSPGIIGSIQYEVFSKLNPRQARIAPFNSNKSRKSPFDVKCITLGPGSYQVEKVISNEFKKINIAGFEERFKEKSKDGSGFPGPGEYTEGNKWDKKTFNVLFKSDN